MIWISKLNSLRIRITTQWVQRFDDWTTIIAILINLIIFYSFQRRVKFSKSEIYKIPLPFFFGTTIDTEKVLNFLGLLHLFLSILMMFYIGVIYIPLILHQKWHYEVQQKKIELSNLINLGKYARILKIKESDDIF